jgi:hypothetical protein
LSAHQSTQWFWSDWAGDQEVRRLTPAERGLWIDLLALAAVGAPAGYVCDQRGKPLSYEEIGRFTNASPTEVESLIVGILEKGVASRDRSGRLFNRRMVRHVQKRAEKAAAGKLGGDQTKKRWDELRSSSLKLSEISSGARAFAVAPARAPRIHPIQSSSIKTTASLLETKGLGEKESKPVSELTRADLDAIYARRGK